MSSLNISTAVHAYAVTPSDTAHGSGSALFVGGAGDVAVLMSGGETVTFKAVPAGTLLPIQFTRIMSTNTTATNMVALYG